MDRQPIALEGWHQRGDLCVDPDDGGKGDGQEGKRSDKNPDDLLLVFELENQIDQDNGPREKDQGLVHVRQGNIAVTGLMRLQPAGDKASRVDDEANDQQGGGEGSEYFISRGRKNEIA